LTCICIYKKNRKYILYTSAQRRYSGSDIEVYIYNYEYLPLRVLRKQMFVQSKAVKINSLYDSKTIKLYRFQTVHNMCNNVFTRKKILYLIHEYTIFACCSPILVKEFGAQGQVLADPPSLWKSLWETILPKLEDNTQPSPPHTFLSQLCQNSYCLYL